MVKKLQAFKAKKGFTLVELIVVIAIIGVLAAILIPTLTAQITKAKVTSADSTAKEIVQTINTWMTDNNVAGGAMPTGAGTIDIVMSGTSCTVTGAIPSKATDMATACSEQIVEDYPNATFGARVFLSDAGKAYACVYQEKATTAPNLIASGASYPTAFAWDSNKKVGQASGIVYGTSPKLPFA